QGDAVSVEAWNNPDERVIVLRRAARDEEGAAPALTLFLNPTGEGLTFRIPPPHVPMRLLIDTDKPDAPERDLAGETIEVAARGRSARRWSIAIARAFGCLRRRNHRSPSTSKTRNRFRCSRRATAGSRRKCRAAPVRATAMCSRAGSACPIRPRAHRPATFTTAVA